MLRFALAPLLVLALGMLAACQIVASPAATPTPTAAPTPPLARATPADGRVVLAIEARGGSTVAVRAEVAGTPDERALGLMNRDALPEGEGMLFIFPSDTTTGFWMRNTKVPLSIAFVDANGVIVGLDDMEPLTEAVHHPPRPYRYALEVPQGFFARHAVATGDEVSYQVGSERRPLAEVSRGRVVR